MIVSNNLIKYYFLNSFLYYGATRINKNVVNHEALHSHSFLSNAVTEIGLIKLYEVSR